MGVTKLQLFTVKYVMSRRNKGGKRCDMKDQTKTGNTSIQGGFKVQPVDAVGSFSNQSDLWSKQEKQASS